MFLRLLLVWVTFLGVLVGSACGVPVSTLSDAGPDGAPPVTNFLELEGEPALTLVFGDEARIAVRYLDADRAPIVGGIVNFSLEGRAHDSTLRGLQGISLEDGVAETNLMAGSTRAAFQVRITAEGADPLFVDIAVGDEGFGQLGVDVLYEGAREVQLGVAVFADLTCEDELTLDGRGDWYRQIENPEDDPRATFIGLPAGASYAVVGRGEGAGGEIVARGCVDGVLIEAEMLAETTVSVLDLPQQANGIYDTTLEFDTPETAALVTTQVAMRYAALSDSGASAILDAAETFLREDGADEAAGLLATARTADGLDALFASAMRTEPSGPELALQQFEQLIRERGQRVVLNGTLRIGDALSFQVMDLMSGDASEVTSWDAPGLADLESTVVGELDGGGEMLGLDSFTIALPTTLLVEGIARAELGYESEDPVTELLIRDATCSELVVPDPVSTYCDATCVEAACAMVVGDLVSELMVGVGDIDGLRSRIEMAGELSLSDDTADLDVDKLMAALDGQWTGDDDGSAEEFAVDLQGDRVVAPR